jgi:hypothetical protein
MHHRGHRDTQRKIKQRRLYYALCDFPFYANKFEFKVNQVGIKSFCKIFSVSSVFSVVKIFEE